MARCRCKYIVVLVITLLVCLTLRLHFPTVFTSQQDNDNYGIVPVEGLGRAGESYPTKAPKKMYPTIKAGVQVMNGVVLRDDDAPRVRGRWFEEEINEGWDREEKGDMRGEGRQPGRKERERDMENIKNNEKDEKPELQHIQEESKQKPKEVDIKAPPQKVNIGSVKSFFTAMPLMNGTNVISMTLYGSELRYTMGAVRNAELAKTNFPGWTLRIYTETPSEHPQYGLVPATVIARLRALGADIHFMDPGEDFVPPMMWRFLIADDEWVDRFIVRDCDARLIERDAAAVYAWIKSNRPFHAIRDHPSHMAYAVSGGMWGAKPKEIRDVIRRSWREMMRGVRKDYLEDMHFLNYVIWPKVQTHAYCSDSVSCDQYPNSYPFPVLRYGYEHVGQVYSEHDLGRSLDIDILRRAGENPNCMPGRNVTFNDPSRKEAVS